MIFTKFRAAACIAILCGVCLFPSACLFAQAPPGPLPPAHPVPPSKPAPPPRKLPEVEPRKTLAGFWKLNADQSDDPRKKLEEARRPDGGSGGGPGGSGGRVGIGFPYPGAGGGNGPYGGGGRGTGGEDNDNDQRMADLVRPEFWQTIVVQDAEVEATNDQDHRLVFYTDGRKIQKSKDASLQQISAHWNGSQLVTDEKGPQGKKMSRTLELSSDGRQLYETWHIENGRSGLAIVMQYVFDAAAEYQR
jgi:hypothetical protein